MNRIDFESLDEIIHGTIFSIPDYRRDYSWGKGEVLTLLDDIHTLYDNNGPDGTAEYFCESIVTIAFDEEVSRNTRGIINSKRLKNYDKMNVIDGQQRLSTLSLLLIAIRDFAEDHGIDLDGVDELIDTGKKDSNGRPVPVMNFSDINTQECYRSLLYKDANKFDKRKLGAKHLLDNYQLCCSFIQDICGTDSVSSLALETIVDQIAYHLTFVGIYCNEDSDAYQIFESLNATGLSLTPAEQVKNIVLMKSQSRDQSLSQWEAISSSVGEDNLVDFLSHYLFYKNCARVSRKDIYSSFKTMLKKDSVSTVLADLTACAKIYTELKDPAANSPARDALLDMADLGLVSSYVPLLAAGVRFGIDTKEYAKIADSILVFAVRHLVCGQSSNKLDSVFGRACEAIVDESKTYEDIVAFFQKEEQRDNTFRDYFQNLTFDYTAKPQKIALTLLRRIEECEHGKHQPLKIERSNLTVEHIIPKQPTTDDLKLWIGSDKIDAKSFDIVDFTNQTIKSIGNLALLYRTENSSASNGGYKEKLETYTTDMKDSEGASRGKPVETFRLLEELVDEYPDRFDDTTVEARAKELAEKAVVAWS